MAFYFDREGTLRLQEFEQWPWLVHGFSTRTAGHLGQPENQEQFLVKLGGDGLKLMTLRQIHSGIVRIAGAHFEPALIPGQPGDALIAGVAGLVVAIKTADCLPILLLDPRTRVVAAVHAGWRGVAQRVAEKAVGEMRRCFACRPPDILAAIGPGIQACCFEVGSEVLEEFASQFADADQFCNADPPNPALHRLPKQVMTGTPGPLRPLNTERGYVDLAEASRRQLLAAGVAKDRIYNSALCTACDLSRFYSYRREGQAAGRMLGVIGVRPDDN